ncbi:hypothetical protein UA08_05233 [Talaromyces atroroseus]|uniref:Uncharacterized protein n=1 Tax=Talaromyces atroroseus TaxID=1441469 RepID=A0A225AYN6_TALAT|nr:hypothetical protein UA08_05233 [Talaromyces atroroseus]OKL59575.1 hypothetical protein UA08_05233 [Talaromyces atroroseus]
METVLVIGSTGNIGVAAIIGALRSQRTVLAIVRNQASAEKLYQHAGTREGITTVEADITSVSGIEGVVAQVKAGKLPAFQHVYSAAGGKYDMTPLHEISNEELRESLNVNFETNFFAYRATIPYLLKKNNPNSTWTLCTGAQGDGGMRAGPAMTQGTLFSMANVACRDNEQTNIRFNEVYLGLRVEVDESAEKTGFFKASHFAKNYQEILARKEIRSCRLTVLEKKDITDLKFKEKRLDLVMHKDN